MLFGLRWDKIQSSEPENERTKLPTVEERVTNLVSVSRR